MYCLFESRNKEGDTYSGNHYPPLALSTNYQPVADIIMAGLNKDMEQRPSMDKLFKTLADFFHNGKWWFHRQLPPPELDPNFLPSLFSKNLGHRRSYVGIQTLFISIRQYRSKCQDKLSWIA